MKAFMDKDFLLSTETSKKLFHEYAETMPIVDYHCHINPQEIAEDRKFENITQVWLGGDHYKWRQMRSNGVDAVSYTHLTLTTNREVEFLVGGIVFRKKKEDNRHQEW